MTEQYDFTQYFLQYEDIHSKGMTHALKSMYALCLSERDTLKQVSEQQ